LSGVGPTDDDDRHGGSVPGVTSRGSIGRVSATLGNGETRAGRSDGSRRLINDIRQLEGLPDVVIRDERDPVIRSDSAAARRTPRE
jgi:hypothetical protein